MRLNDHAMQVVGVTTTLPEVAFSLDPDADSNLEIRLLGRHGFSLWSASVKESVSLFPTADGRVYVYFDGVCVKKLETNFPADTQLWGAVDVCRSCVKIKSEILSGKDGNKDAPYYSGAPLNWTPL